MKFTCLAFVYEVINVIGWMATVGGAIAFVYILGADKSYAPDHGLIGFVGVAMGILAVLWAGAVSQLVAIKENARIGRSGLHRTSSE